jgi:hypothetical protein
LPAAYLSHDTLADRFGDITTFGNTKIKIAERVNVIWPLAATSMAGHFKLIGYNQHGRIMFFKTRFSNSLNFLDYTG